MDSKNKILNTIKYLSLVGIIVAGYSLYEYYFSSGSAFCDINSTFSCYGVYHSGYSEIFGIPVSLLGIIGFGLIFICAAWSLQGLPAGRQGKNTHKLLLPLTSLSLLSVIYFAYLSAFVINVWCPSCIISWIIIVILFIYSILLEKSRV